MIKEREALSESIMKTIEDAKHGVIIMSFGTLAPDVKEHIFVDAFRQIKQVVFWRYRGEPIKDLPPNVHTFDWLPQADLLAHPKHQ